MVMPIHDWTKVPSGIFHDFHHSWIEEIHRHLNRGHLPEGFYALVERVSTCSAAGSWPLQGAEADGTEQYDDTRTELEIYAIKAKVVTIRHASEHHLVAMIEIVSPGNKSSKARIDSFDRNADEALTRGVHLLIVDLFPPTVYVSARLHRGRDFELSVQKPLTCAAYVGDLFPEAFVEPIAIGDTLAEMPLFLTPDV
jgi:hypothetical protein